MTIENSYIEIRTPALPYYLGSGCSRFKVGDHHPSRRNLGIYDWLLVVKGELHIGENGQEWRLSAGDTLLLLPGGEHYSVAPCGEETIFYWVHFEHTDHRELADDASKGALYSSRPFGNPHAIRLPKQLRLTSPQPFYDLLEQLLALPISSSFWEEQQLLARLLSMLEDVGSSGSSSMASRLAERAASYIQNHYRDKITNESLAAALHFHPNYVVRCMKARYDRTPMDYLHEFRLDRAKRLLITTEWTIERIAEETGFRYAPYFSSCFKRNAGMSPLRYRWNYWH